MKPTDLILDPEPEIASVGKIRWLSFCLLRDFDFLSHGFVIKSKERNLSTQAKKNAVKRFFEKESSEQKHLIVPRQIHGNRCLTLKRGDPLKKSYQGDAILTDRRDVLLTVSVADCVPIFLVEPKSRVVVLIHAGWRGTLLGIAGQTMRRACTDFCRDPRDFTILVGPAIGRCCYEISETIAILFDEDCLIRTSGQRPRLDLILANVKQFLNCGVEEEKIFATSECTCCNEEMFHSFRRDGDKAGRMFAFLGIK
jgi:YfiH family protein